MPPSFADSTESEFKPSTLVEILRRRANEQPNRLAYTFLADGETEEASLTYEELDRQVQNVAAWLQSVGTGGERVLLLFPAGLEYVVAFLGCLYAGAVAVPAYPPRASRTLCRLEAIVADAEAKIALTTAALLPRLQAWLADSPNLKHLRWQASDQINADEGSGWHEPTIDSDTLAFLQYTSGSTATPRGPMLTHGNLLYNHALIQKYFELTPDSRYVSWLPNYHDMGLIGCLLQSLYTGFPCVLMAPEAFLQRPFVWLNAISRYRGTMSSGPNFAYDLCVRKITSEQRALLDLSSWQSAANGAEPISAKTLDQFAATFAPCGFRREAFYPCYGLAEATLIVSGGRREAPPIVKTFDAKLLEYNRVREVPADAEGARTLVSCGQTLAEQEIVIAHPERLTRSAPDEVGEIWVAGRSVAQGYWNRPDETERVFGARLADTGAGPFLRTGDLGFLCAGELFVTGRLKDLIIIRGGNYYPQDIERTVEQSHYLLRQGCSAAFSIERDGAEQLVISAEVEHQYQSANFTEVVGAIRQAVAANHDLQVYAVALLKSRTIPKTSSGKIQRHACRAAFLKGTLATVS